MIKKTLTHSLKVLKISTWISVIAALLIVLMVGFLVVFPAFLKAPIAQQLSSASAADVSLSRITFGLDDGDLIVNVHDIEMSDTEHKNQPPLVQVDHLYWRLDWLSLFADIYNPSVVEIDTLSIYSGTTDMSMADIHSFVTPEVLNTLALFKTLSVDKTVITGDYNLELMPLILAINKQQLQLKLPNQTLGGKTFDIDASFALEQVGKSDDLIVPMTIDSADFSLQSELVLYRENNRDFIKFNAVSKHINMVDVPKYLPPEIVGELTNAWMRQAFKSGELDDISINIKQNMIGQGAIEVNFDAHLSNADLLFDSQWPILQQLDADISTNGKQLNIKVNSAILNQLSLQNIDVALPDMTKDILEVEVAGKINTQSEDIIEFLSRTPLRDTVEPILEQFTLFGKAAGEIDLLIPLSDGTPTIDVDLHVSSNHLTVLDGAIKVENFDSDVGFHNNIITTQGAGSIRGETFNIRVNPNDRASDNNVLFAVELTNADSQFNTYISQQSEQLWQAKVNSEAVKTDIEIALSSNDVPIVTLIDLKVTTLDKIKGDWQILPSDLPSMHLKSRGMQVDDYQLPDFKVDLRANSKVLNIHNLEFDGIGVNDNNLSFDGNWLNGITTLVASAKGDKLSDFLTQMNIKEKATGGAFDLDIRLFCQCEPWNINLNDISGYVSMNVKEGVFTEQDPNIGRVLSLLNIQSITRRLKLQTNDLTDAGFAYDNIETSIYLGNALAKIDKFELSATSSSIHLSGNSNIVEQQYNLVAIVRPAVSDAIPIATFLAGGGLAGLGVWAVDKLLFDGKIMNTMLDNVAEFEYDITGPWDNPTIK